MPEFRIGRFDGGLAVTWWEGGKRRRYRLETLDRKEAEAEAIDVYRRETIKVTDTTVKELWAAYRKEKEGRRVAEAMKHEWKAMGPHFGALRHDQVSVDICRAYTALRRKQGKQDGTIWTELGHLRSVFLWAQNVSRLIAFAPAVERPSKPAPKDRWLNTREIEAFMDAPGAPHVDLACILMLSTAARVSAVLELAWDRVDFDNGIIDLREDTTGPRKGRAVVPMNAGARAALSAAKNLALTDNVVEYGGCAVKSIKKGFALKAKASGLEGVTPHVLRHTAAVHLAKAGVKMSRISQYLGHTSTAVTERVYARFAPEHLRKEADILDFVSHQKRAV